MPNVAPEGGWRIDPKKVVFEQDAAARRWFAGVAALIVLVLATAIGTYEARKDTRATLTADLAAAVRQVLPGLARVRMIGPRGSYWVPDAGMTPGSNASAPIYARYLWNVNRGTDSPTCLLSPVVLLDDGTFVAASSTATCAGVLGRTWSTVVGAEVTAPTYTTR